MPRLLAVVAIAISGLSTYAQSPSNPDLIVPVWPQTPPTWLAPQEEERDTTQADGRHVGGKRVIRLGFVSKPELHIYRPAKNAGETVVLVCPGGGYSILAWDLEGTEIAEWLNGIGITAIVVKYRVPTRGNDPRWLPPVQDIQRSISLVRSGGIEGVSAANIGVLGFSAGGNASARVATSGKRHYQPIDDHDDASAKPDFAVLIYPAGLVQGDSTELIDEIEVNRSSPPMFFAHAADDRIDCMNSVTLFAALKEQGVAAALHVFNSGGHGFGGRNTGKPSDAWPSLCASWLESQGWLD